MKKRSSPVSWNVFSAVVFTAILVAQASVSFASLASEGPVTLRQESVLCEGVDGEVRFEIAVEISNPSDGSKAMFKAMSRAMSRAISMRVSDPNVSALHSEVAFFDASKGVLNNDRGVIIGYVDSEDRETFRRGERIGGTTLGQLRSIMVSLDMEFDLESPVAKKYSAQATYLKKSGGQLIQDLDCIRQR